MTESRHSSSGWYHFAILLVTAAFLLYFQFHLPSPQKALLVFGGTTALMMLAEMRPIHKAGYVLLLLLLLIIENRAINQDRAKFAWQEESNLRAERASFKTVIEGIAQSIEQGQSQLQATTNGFRAEVDTMTGGDSFAYLDMTNLITPHVFVVGRNPLHAVSMTITDVNADAKLVQSGRPPTIDEIMSVRVEMTFDELTGANAKDLYPIPPLLQRLTKRDLDIVFAALNGIWLEKICLRRATNAIPGMPGPLASTIIVRRGNKVIMRQADTTYPIAEVCK